MTTVTLDYAQKNLSRLLAEVEAGGEVVIKRDDTPVARLVAEPTEKPLPQRRAGMWKGRIALDDSFFDPLPEEELALWEGGSDEP